MFPVVSLALTVCLSVLMSYLLVSWIDHMDYIWIIHTSLFPWDVPLSPLFWHDILNLICSQVVFPYFCVAVVRWLSCVWLFAIPYTCFSIYLPWSDGTGCHDLSFLNVEYFCVSTYYITWHSYDVGEYNCSVYIFNLYSRIKQKIIWHMLDVQDIAIEKNEQF